MAIPIENINPDYPRTISEDLFATWLRLKRTGDPVKLAEKHNLSRVPFDNALKWGHCPKAETVDFVNIFFKERLTSEKDSAVELNALADEVQTLKKKKK